LKVQEELKDPKADRTLELKFRELSHWTHFDHQKRNNTMISKIMLPFLRTYLCEQGFSMLMEIKTSKRE
jgi:hypothetical protein